jgi:hypothetical protein
MDFRLVFMDNYRDKKLSSVFVRFRAPLAWASVEVLHKPTGTKYYSTTDVDGKYAVQGLEPGGPYG